MSLGSRLRTVLAEWRIARLNRKPGVKIAAPSYFDRLARVDLTPEGFGVGGSVTIGERSRIGVGVILAPYGGEITIGNDAFIGPYCVLYGHSKLTIGDNVLIGAHATIVPANHSFADCSLPICKQGTGGVGISIQDDVWIGAGVRVLDGVVIGSGSIVGAGSVLTRSVPKFSICVGVPARVVRSRLMNLEGGSKL